MASAQIGPLTTLLEAAATAVGAGVVLVSVAVGIWCLAVDRPRSAVEDLAVKGGYFGGGLGAAIALVDAVLRYGVR
jgi:hypothetical protein